MREIWPSNVSTKSYKGPKGKEENSSSVIGFREKDKSNKGDGLSKKGGIRRKGNANNTSKE
jgi:hypothetical protein